MPRFCGVMRPKEAIFTYVLDRVFAPRPDKLYADTTIKVTAQRMPLFLGVDEFIRRVFHCGTV